MENRKNHFTWHSRQDLYDYFTHKGLTIGIIDKTIEKALTSFVVRSGSAINIDELWQKCGESLLKDISKRER